MGALGWLLNLDFAGSTTAVEVPTIPGIEFSMPENRTHFAMPENRTHYTVPENRTHFVMPEEDR